MIGGDADVVRAARPDLRGAGSPGEGGAANAGTGRGAQQRGARVPALRTSGAGHFVKMVHNGIEYGIMAAYAEGLNILRHANVGSGQRTVDAETAPLRDPELYQYDFDLRDIAEVWRRGSVIASWLLDLTAAALQKSPELSDFAGRVSDSGEGRWALKAAIDESVPAPVLSTALNERFASRGENDFADRLLSAMRFQFGGHLEKHFMTGASLRGGVHPSPDSASMRGADAANSRTGAGMEEQSRFKRAAAERAVDFLESGMTIGLGAGSTADFAMRRVGELVASGRLTDIVGMPCSRQVAAEASRLGITLSTLNEHPAIDTTIDGADEVDPDLESDQGRWRGAAPREDGGASQPPRDHSGRRIEALAEAWGRAERSRSKSWSSAGRTSSLPRVPRCSRAAAAQGRRGAISNRRGTPHSRLHIRSHRATGRSGSAPRGARQDRRTRALSPHRHRCAGRDDRRRAPPLAGRPGQCQR